MTKSLYAVVRAARMLKVVHQRKGAFRSDGGEVLTGEPLMYLVGLFGAWFECAPKTPENVAAYNEFNNCTNGAVMMRGPDVVKPNLIPTDEELQTWLKRKLMTDREKYVDAIAQAEQDASAAADRVASAIARANEAHERLALARACLRAYDGT